MKKPIKLPKQRNMQLHMVLVSKSSSGSSGRHVHIKSKNKINRIFKQLDKRDYYE